MEVIPAIDLRAGRCVRLYQGDYDRETVFSDDPVEVATRWASLGAARLHVVDLDGAREGASANLDVVRRIAAAVSLPVQVGGGIRTAEAASAALDAGAHRVIVGTAAVRDPDLAPELCAELGADRVVVSVDARDGYVAVQGWTEGSDTTAAALVRRMEGRGVRRFMYTDIARDGTLEGPNFAAIERLLGETGAHLIAAGGVTTVDDLLRLRDMGLEGAIVGRAIYTGDLDLEEALEAVGLTGIDEAQRRC